MQGRHVIKKIKIKTEMARDSKKWKTCLIFRTGEGIRRKTAFQPPHLPAQRACVTTRRGQGKGEFPFIPKAWACFHASGPKAKCPCAQLLFATPAVVALTAATQVAAAVFALLWNAASQAALIRLSRAQGRRGSRTGGRAKANAHGTDTLAEESNYSKQALQHSQAKWPSRVKHRL